MLLGIHPSLQITTKVQALSVSELALTLIVEIMYIVQIEHHVCVTIHGHLDLIISHLSKQQILELRHDFQLIEMPNHTPNQLHAQPPPHPETLQPPKQLWHNLRDFVETMLVSNGRNRRRYPHPHRKQQHHDQDSLSQRQVTSSPTNTLSVTARE